MPPQVRYDFDLHACVAGQLASKGIRTDANETAAFTRELEYVHAEVIRAKYPAFKWRSVIPLKTGLPMGVTSHRYFEVDGFGDADFLDGFGTEDFPTVEVKGTENTEKIRSLGDKYAYTIEDLRAASLMRVNVEAEKALLARRGIESKFDRVVFGVYNAKIGGFKGLLHDDLSTLYTPASVVNGGSNGSWATATSPGLMVADVRKMLDAAFIDTKGAFPFFDLLLPPELGVQLGAPMSFTDGANTRYTDMSIAEYMLKNIPRLRSISNDCHRLSAAGASGKHRALAFPRDPEVLDAVVPIEFEQFAPQLSGMAFETFCHAKYGGIRMKHVKACRRMDLTV